MVGGVKMAKAGKDQHAAMIGIRPEHMQEVTKAKAKLSGTITHIEHLGEYAIGYVALPDGTSITAKLDDTTSQSVGSVIHLSFDPKRLHLFDGDGKIIR